MRLQVTKASGDRLKSGLGSEGGVLLELDWRESITHPDNRCWGRGQLLLVVCGHGAWDCKPTQ